jgi:hypothetical protein
MTISYVGAASANSDTVNISGIGLLAGDVVILWVYRNASAVAPTIPTDWIGINTTSGASNWLGLFWCGVGATLPTVGTWTNATQIIAVGYRPTTGKALSIARSAVTGGTAGSGGAITYTQISTIGTPSDSWILGAVGHRSIDTDCEVAPSGMVNRTSVVGGADGELAAHDSDSTQTTWASTDYTLTSGTSSGYRTMTGILVECDAPSGSGLSPALINSQALVRGIVI